MKVVLEHGAVIPPLRYGGTERVIAWLARGLLELGHEVTLISKPSPHPIPGVRPLEWSPDWQTRYVAEIAPADVLHLWGTPSPDWRFECPVLVTIQGNGKPGEVFHPNTVFVSRNHAERHGGSYYVYNGLDPEQWDCDERRSDHVVFLAKASWTVKNLAGAIEVARAAGCPLEVLGSRSLPGELQRLLPRWKGVRYHGMVDDPYKRRILRSARALLFPVRWHEPFGIALTEALSAGCPVLGTPYGSLPEIVGTDVGLLSPRAKDLVMALGGALPSASVCRSKVEREFSYPQMTRRYLELYSKIAQAPLHPESAPPRTLSRTDPGSLLEWVGL